jgi:hypothetical protein
MLWFAVLPLVYAVLLSGRWFIAWTALNNVVALVFVVIVSWSLVERPAPTPAVARLLALTDVGLGLVMVGVMVGLTSKAVREAERRRSPHRVAAYLQDLARDFHGFYHRCRVVGEAPEVVAFRLDLLRATRSVIAMGLGLIGVEAPDRM